jgi:hypothetical protein
LGHGSLPYSRVYAEKNAKKAKTPLMWIKGMGSSRAKARKVRVGQRSCVSEAAQRPVLPRETTGTISWWRRSRRGSGLGRNVVLSTSAPSREQRHEDRGDGTRAVDESGGVFTEAFAMVGFLSEFAGMRDSVNTI